MISKANVAIAACSLQSLVYLYLENKRFSLFFAHVEINLKTRGTKQGNNLSFFSYCTQISIATGLEADFDSWKTLLLQNTLSEANISRVISGEVGSCACGKEACDKESVDNKSKVMTNIFHAININIIEKYVTRYSKRYLNSAPTFL